MKLDALFQNPTALPTAPKVVEELISSFDKASVSTEEIAKKLSTDPVLSAKLLRLANSAYYHVSRSIGTVEDAVLMLGFVTVRTLVICVLIALLTGFVFQFLAVGRAAAESSAPGAAQGFFNWLLGK